jgi:hypothetical protein
MELSLNFQIKINIHLFFTNFKNIVTSPDLSLHQHKHTNVRYVNIDGIYSLRSLYINFLVIINVFFFSGGSTCVLGI